MRYSRTHITHPYISCVSGRTQWTRRRRSKMNARERQREGLRTHSCRTIALASDVRGRRWVARWGLTGLFHRDLCEDLVLVFLAHWEFVYCLRAIYHYTTLQIICWVLVITILNLFVLESYKLIKQCKMKNLENTVQYMRIPVSICQSLATVSLWYNLTILFQAHEL